MSRASEADEPRSDAHDVGCDDTSDTATASDTTYVGVSVGVDTLLTAAPAAATPGTTLVVDGAHVQTRHEILTEATRALQGANFETTTSQAQLFAAMWHQLRPQVYEIATRVVRYAQQFQSPELVLAEPDATSTASLWRWRAEPDELAWLPTALRQAVAERAREAGVAVTRVDRDAASGVCHHCGAAGEVNAETGTFVCEHDNCPVGRMARGRNAAVRLARRGRPVERRGEPVERRGEPVDRHGRPAE